jgi:hypothetical protein
MLRQDDPESTVAEGTLTESEAVPLPARALKRERERITIPGYGERLRLMRLGPPILFIPIGLAGRLLSVSA